MSINRCFLIIEEDKIVVKRNDLNKRFICSFEKAERYPNVPLHHFLWGSKEWIGVFANFYKNEILAKKSFLRKLVKPTIFVALPDDALKIDRSIIADFLLSEVAKEVLFVPTCSLADLSEETYVFISGTSRLFVLTYIKNGMPEFKTVVEPKEYPLDEMVRIKNSLHFDCNKGDIPTYLYGKGMLQYEEMGKLLTTSEILENMSQYVGDMKTNGKGEFILAK